MENNNEDEILQKIKKKEKNSNFRISKTNSKILNFSSLWQKTVKLYGSSFSRTNLFCFFSFYFSFEIFGDFFLLFFFLFRLFRFSCSFLCSAVRRTCCLLFVKERKMPPKGKKPPPKKGAAAAPKKEEKKIEKAILKESYRSATGVLESRPRALDVKIGGFSLTAWGKELIKDTRIEFTIGRRYGLIGSNGSGKRRRQQEEVHKRSGKSAFRIFYRISV